MYLQEELRKHFIGHARCPPLFIRVVFVSEQIVQLNINQCFELQFTEHYSKEKRNVKQTICHKTNKHERVPPMNIDVFLHHTQTIRITSHNGATITLQSICKQNKCKQNHASLINYSKCIGT